MFRSALRALLTWGGTDAGSDSGDIIGSENESCCVRTKNSCCSEVAPSSVFPRTTRWRRRSGGGRHVAHPCRLCRAWPGGPALRPRGAMSLWSERCRDGRTCEYCWQRHALAVSFEAWRSPRQSSTALLQKSVAAILNMFALCLACKRGTHVPRGAGWGENGALLS